MSFVQTQVPPVDETSFSPASAHFAQHASISTARQKVCVWRMSMIATITLQIRDSFDIGHLYDQRPSPLIVTAHSIHGDDHVPVLDGRDYGTKAVIRSRDGRELLQLTHREIQRRARHRRARGLQRSYRQDHEYVLHVIQFYDAPEIRLGCGRGDQSKSTQTPSES